MVISIIPGALCARALISAVSVQTGTINGRQAAVYEFTGAINRGAQYPYAGVTFTPDAAALARLRSAVGLSDPAKIPRCRGLSLIQWKYC